MLNSTLRHDYGPERSQTYFEECKIRLQVVERALEDDVVMAREDVAANMRRLSSLGSRISLIERAHLGEFSWPFAGIMEDIADKLFVETSLDDEMEPIELTPIVHVVAEGTDYQIVDDEVPLPGRRRIIIVAFPRQLKHHVLLHAIFGHELGHTAISAERPGSIMKNLVLPRACRGPLRGKHAAKAWIERTDAPASVKLAMSRNSELCLDEQSLINWRQEIICDLFGLRLFGPSFAAAHRTIIEALCPREDYIDLESNTHPPYPIRQRIVAMAVKLLGWDTPVTTAAHGAVHDAEKNLLAYISESVNDDWFTIFQPPELKNLLDGIEEVLRQYNFFYTSPSAELLQELVERLAHERPPISQQVDDDGQPTNRAVMGAHCLYAGWTYWFSGDELVEKAQKTDPDVKKLTFLELNRLCDQALLQQKAISLVNG